MKKAISILILATILLNSCSQENPLGTQNEQPQPKRMHTNVIDTAASISSSKASSIALQFTGAFTDSRSTSTVSEVIPITGSASQVCMYAVNFSAENGYVLVSASRATDPILAYVPVGSFNPDAVDKPGLGLWLKDHVANIEANFTNEKLIKTHAIQWLEYMTSSQETSASRSSYIPEDLQQEIYHAQEDWISRGWTYYPVEEWLNNLAHNPSTGLEQRMMELRNETSPLTMGSMSEISFLVLKDLGSTNTIGPLIGTQWGQDYPYNSHIPYGRKAGCSAIAAAQILKFYAGIPGFDFQAMPDRLTLPDANLGQFIRHVGEKLGIDYSAGPSSATLLDISKCLDLYNYSYTAVKHSSDRVEQSIRNRRPICLRGTSTSGGHAWICEGLHEIRIDNRYSLMIPKGSVGDVSGIFIEETGEGQSSRTVRFYYNWGWGGLDNGFYADNISWPTSTAEQGSGISDKRFIQDRVDLVEIRPK